MIIQDNKQKIQDFERYVREKLASIELINGNDRELLKKILYVAFIDSVAACVYPGKGNRDRFVDTINRFAQWEDRNRVSTIHIARYVYSTSDPVFEKIRNYVQPIINQWKTRVDEYILISEDPLITDDAIKPALWKRDKDSMINFSPQDFSHGVLIYKMRNELVHQFQAQANNLLPSAPNKPFYQVVRNLQNEQFEIELVYPSEFFKGIAESILDNVIEYFISGNINPFPSYYSGNYFN